MRDELRKKLDALESVDRKLPIFGLVVRGIIGGVNSLPRWTGNDTRIVTGVVRFAAPNVNPDTGQRGLTLQVELANGKLVNVESFPLIGLAPPAAGTTVKLTERESFTGFRSYVWAPPQ